MSTLLLDKIINQHLGAYSKKCSNSSKKTKATSRGGGGGQESRLQCVGYWMGITDNALFNRPEVCIGVATASVFSGASISLLPA